VTFRAAFDDIASAGQAVESIMTSSLVPDVLELMDGASVEAVEAIHPIGLDLPAAGAVLVGQFIGREAQADVESAADLCRTAGGHGVEVSQSDDLLEARRLTSRALTAAGLRVSSDVAVPIGALTDMFRAIQAISASEGVAIPTFAHAGDGNLHPSVIVTTDDPAELENAERILERIIDAALDLGGTMSGEHGVGSLKWASLPRQLDTATLAANRLVKTAFDPLGILNPGRGI
jgi:glycolate oxidase